MPAAALESGSLRNTMRVKSSAKRPRALPTTETLPRQEDMHQLIWRFFAIVRATPQEETEEDVDQAKQSQQEQQSKTIYMDAAGVRLTASRRQQIVGGNGGSGCDSVHQTGTKYRSNNAGDGPEKTRDRKNWFPRFKSNWLGTYRSKQMFLCCECAVGDVASARYKGAEGKHCSCGSDQWHLAKSVEEQEYNRRMEVSKAFGGMRYDEAVLRLKSMGGSENDLARLRCESDDKSSLDGSETPEQQPTYTSTVESPASRTYATSRSERAHLSFGLGQQQPQLSPALPKTYQGPPGSYAPLEVEFMAGGGAPNHHQAYEQYLTTPFTDEENFTDLLQGILEDDHHGIKREQYPMVPQSMPQQPTGNMDFEFFAHPQQYHGHHAHHHHAPQLLGEVYPLDVHPHHHLGATYLRQGIASSSSFSSAV